MKTFLVKLPDRNIMVEPMKLKHLKEIWLNHVMMLQYKYTEDEYQEWIDTFLENMFPDLNPYEREYAFVQVYGHASNSAHKQYKVICPKCNSDEASLLISYKKAELKPFEVDIGDYRVYYSLPEEVGDVGYPVSISELNQEVEEGQKGDILISGNKSIPWRPGIPKSAISKIIRPVGEKINLEELDKDSYEAVINSLKDVQAEYRFNEFSTSPVSGTATCKCQCGYSHTTQLYRVIDVLMNTINMQDIPSLNMTKISYHNANYASHEDIDNMDMIEFTLFQNVIRSIEKSKKESK